MEIQKILEEAVKTKSSDIHLHTDEPLFVRINNGSLYPIEKLGILKSEDVFEIIKKITNKEQYDIFMKNKQYDFSYNIEGVGRFRVNIYFEKKGPAAAFRSIPEIIPTFEQINLPKSIENLCYLPRGLILVTGPTGSGKSTTLAAMIDFINANTNSHIITIEDPIEFVFKRKKSMITQREINMHTTSFLHAIRAALREDPNVVLVGEMRDLETISAALTLSETGHLVLSTLHTVDAAQTVDRIIDVFPPYQQQQIRAQLALTLKAVISQTLVPHISGKGRVAAREIMMVTDGVKGCILEGKTHQIYSTIQIGKKDGMCLLDDSLLALYKNGIIGKADAISKAMDAESLKQRLDL